MHQNETEKQPVSARRNKYSRNLFPFIPRRLILYLVNVYSVIESVL